MYIWKKKKCRNRNSGKNIMSGFFSLTLSHCGPREREPSVTAWMGILKAKFSGSLTTSVGRGWTKNSESPFVAHLLPLLAFKSICCIYIINKVMFYNSYTVLFLCWTLKGSCILCEKCLLTRRLFKIACPRELCQLHLQLCKIWWSRGRHPDVLQE